MMWPSAQRGQWSLATWNVNSIGARERQVLDWIELNGPDVLTEQETQCSTRRFPRAGFAALGYQVIAHGDGGSNGVAIVSKVSGDEVVHGDRMRIRCVAVP